MMTGVTVLGWIVAGGLAMTAVAGVGAVFAFRTLSAKTTLVLVALSAGSLLGGALFHMMPAALARTDDTLAPFVWLAFGFSIFLVLEQFLHWHHCHRGCDEHTTLQPVGSMILIADGLHNFLGGLAIGGAFIVDVKVGIMAWIAAAAHELPQELGDFGVLVHSGWSKRRALAFNIISASTFLIGGIVAWALSREIDTWVLLPFAAGNFIYIAAADLIPEIKHHPEPARSALHFLTFMTGMAILLGLRLVIHE